MQLSIITNMDNETPHENDVVEVDETERIIHIPNINYDWMQQIPSLETTFPTLLSSSTWNRRQTPVSPRRTEFLQTLSFLRRINTGNATNVEQRIQRITHSARRFLHIMESRYPTETQQPDFRLLDLQYVFGRRFTLDVGEQRQRIVAENDVFRNSHMLEILTPLRPRGYAIVDDMQDGVEIRNFPFVTIARRRSGRTHEFHQIIQQWTETLNAIENIQSITSQQLNSFHHASSQRGNYQSPITQINREFDGDEMNIFLQPFKKHANYADYCILCETPNSGVALLTPTSENNENAEQPECSICLENYQPTDVCVLANFCGHIFHRQCLEKWIDESDECPLCRQNMKKIQIMPFLNRFPEENSENRDASVVVADEWHGLFLEEVN